MLAKLHLAEDAFALHLPLQRLERLVDIVVSNENLHEAFLFNRAVEKYYRLSVRPGLGVYKQHEMLTTPAAQLTSLVDVPA